MESISGGTRATSCGAQASGTTTGPGAADLANLVQRIAGGDHDALGELYDVTVSRLYALARLILRNSADAEDVVCDVYIQVWQNAAKFQGERGAVMGWLFVICRSRALDLNRRNRLRARLASLETSHGQEEPREPTAPEDILDLMKQGTVVHLALRKLTLMQRRLVALAFFKGLSHSEIADECHLPMGTVKSQIRRALSALRAELTEGGSGAAPLA